MIKGGHPHSLDYDVDPLLNDQQVLTQELLAARAARDAALADAGRLERIVSAGGGGPFPASQASEMHMGGRQETGEGKGNRGDGIRARTPMCRNFDVQSGGCTDEQ